ncbi:cytochrome P450 [Promicromonospora sp. NPDC023987]|uniref:cytochrome P450 n=1 Tax=Promicromonospora sp. NPDC023987 TaxID=3155360 RepID=UPI00340C8FF5
MSNQTATDNTTDLPAFPGKREARCPFAPPSEYTDWRAKDGLQRVERKGELVWAASRFEDVRTVLSDPRISAALPEDEGSPAAFPGMDDPEHARLRMMLTRDFSVKRVQQMRPHIQGLVDDILETMISKGSSADLVRDYALPIPSLVISLLLGVPYADHGFFQDKGGALLDTRITKQERDAVLGELLGYLGELVERKEREPADDLLSRLVTERVQTGQLSREMAAMNGVLLLIAGHETTSNMISLSTLVLLQDPEQLTRIRDTEDPAVIKNAVEELLRYTTIAQDQIMRVAAEDVTVGGQLIRAGDLIVANLPSGNRDEAIFTDPDTLDIDRNTRGHLAFGYGVHQCLGQNLARAELEIALPTLLRRLPGLKLAVPMEQIRFRDEMVTYGPHELPVTW